LWAASVWFFPGCSKIGCGKEEKKPISQTMQQDTTFQELPAEEQPDLMTPPPQPQSGRPMPQVVSVADGKYTVQVSSWRTRRKAEEDAQRYVAQGFEAYVQDAYIPEKDGTWYRVRVGRFATQFDAEQMAAQLAGLLESGFWVDRVRPEQP
jgi:cell division protein FtsN